MFVSEAAASRGVRREGGGKGGRLAGGGSRIEQNVWRFVAAGAN